MAKEWPHAVGLWVWVWAWVWVAGGPHLQTEGFNLSPTHHKVLRGPPDTQFGFSVALWSYNASKRLVVGAPKGKNSSVGRGELALGMVFYCNVSGEDDCHLDARLPMVNDNDKSKPALDEGPTMRDQGMAFGHSMATLKVPESPIAICAPRYPRLEGKSIENRGACFVLDTPDSDPVSLVFKSGTVPTLQTFENAMLGFSVALDYEMTSLVVGGPKAFHGEGLVQVSPMDKSTGFLNRLHATDRSTVPTPPEASFEGWALTLGKFDNSSITIAASAINHGKFTGKVSFYPQNMGPFDDPLHTLYGNETGARFGFSLGSGDVDGNGVDDLLVGSPLSTGSSSHLTDAGKIFVYYAPLVQDGETRPPQQVIGSDLWGRFGSALTSLGDLNNDGYHDVAVAAPYGGENREGVVFIYNGGASGLIVNRAQTLRASQYSHGLRGFGLSLDGGLDMDNNGYPDLLVGATDSDAAVFIRSAPVISLVGGVNFASPNVTAEDGDCTVSAPGYKSFHAVCFQLTFNISYDSTREIKDLKLRFRVVLEGKEDTSHFGFPSNSNNDHRYTRNKTVSKVGGRPRIWSVSVFMKRDRSNIGLNLHATISVSPVRVDQVVAVADAPVPPVMDIYTATTFNATTTLVCRDNKTCFSQPDMVLSAAGRPVTLGEELVKVDVLLEVRDDPAYKVEVEVQPPAVVRYARVDGDGTIPECKYKLLTGQEVTDNTPLICSFQFIEADAKVNFTLLFNYDSVQLLEYLLEQPYPRLPLNLAVTSDSEGDTNTANNKAEINVDITISSVLHTTADALPETKTVMVNLTASKEKLKKAAEDPFPVDLLGPHLEHRFSFTNRGPSPIMAAKLVFHLPVYLGHDLSSYFTQQATTTGPVNCSTLDINILSLQPPSGVDDDGTIRRSTYPTNTSGTTPFEDTTPTVSEESPMRRRHRRQVSLSDDYFSSWTTEATGDFITTHDPSDPAIAERLYYPEETSEDVECHRPECAVTCDVGLLKEDEQVKVSFSSYLVMATISKMRNNTVAVSVWMVAEVEQEGATFSNQRIRARTYVSMIRPPKTGLFALPLWILLLAVGISVFLIVIIIVVCWKAGFFKRDRPPSGHKRQSLRQPDDEKDDKEKF